MAVPIGALLGVGMSPFYVSDFTEDRRAEVKGEIEHFLLVHAIVVLVLNILMIFYKEAPENYPSQAAKFSNQKEKFDLRKETKDLLKNKNYLLFMVAFSMVYSMYTALGAIINALIAPYGFTN